MNLQNFVSTVTNSADKIKGFYAEDPEVLL